MRSAVVNLIGPARYASARSMYHLATEDEEFRGPLPLGTKLRAWRHGFNAASAALYGWDNVESGLYVSDYQRQVKCKRLNAVPAAFDHKYLLRRILSERGVGQPETVAFASKNGLVLDPLGEPRYCAPDELTEIITRRGGRYIWKPENGTRGEAISLLEVVDGELVSRRGDSTRPFRFARLRGAIKLLETAVEQHAFWQALSPASVNTLRILTLWTPGDAAPFIARAVQRVGTRATLPTDNWSGGGVCALVDLATGELGPGRVNPFKSGRENRLYSHHPETGAQIQGAVLPHWRAIADATLAAARAMPDAPYIGWDMAVDTTGRAVVIEGNKNTDVDLLQVHGGLLADPRVRRFYEVCGVV